MTSICHSELLEHRDVNIMALGKCKHCLNDYEDVFKFISFAAPLLLLAVVLYQPSKWVGFLAAR